MLNFDIKVKTYFCFPYVEEGRTALFIPRDATQVDFERHNIGLNRQRIFFARLIAIDESGNVTDYETHIDTPTLTVDDEWGDYRGIYLDGEYSELEHMKSLMLIIGAVI